MESRRALQQRQKMLALGVFLALGIAAALVLLMPTIAAAAAHRVVGQSIERAVALRQREQQRHAGERQEECRWEAADHRIDRHVSDIHADDPRHGNRQHADIQRRHAADDDGDDEGGDGEDGQIHAAPVRSERRSSAGCSARVAAKSCTW